MSDLTDRPALTVALLVSVGVTLVSGCSGDRVPEPRLGFEVRDSAGVLVIENGHDVMTEAPLIRLFEDLRIGAADRDPELEFFWVADVAVTEEGKVYALDGGHRLVRVIGPEGTLIHSFGGPGEGPGEFSSDVDHLSVSADTVVVHSRTHLHVFTAEGIPVSRASKQFPWMSIPPVIGRGPEGWLLAQVSFASPTSPQERTTRDTLRVWPLDLRTGTRGSPVLEIPSNWRRYLPDMGRSREQWLGPQAAASVRTNGEVYFVEGDDFEIHVASTGGEPLRVIRGHVDRVPVPDELSEDPRDFRFGDDEARELGVPEVRPVAGRLIVSPDGRVLMLRRDLSPAYRRPGGGPSDIWDLLGSDGRLEGRLSVPPDVELKALLDSHVFGVERDESGVHYVVRYRMAPESR